MQRRDRCKSDINAKVIYMFSANAKKGETDGKMRQMQR
jgi:hypothetical protein